jgi:hypothetical protein
MPRSLFNADAGLRRRPYAEKSQKPPSGNCCTYGDVGGPLHKDCDSILMSSGTIERSATRQRLDPFAG